MTRARVYGEDTGFGDWMRSNPRLDSTTVCLSATDRDFTVHRYKNTTDAIGARDVQLMFALEVKSFTTTPDRISDAQKQTKFFEHQLLRLSLKRNTLLMCSWKHMKRPVWHFGYYFVLLPTDRPSDDPNGFVGWGCFTDEGGIWLRSITVGDLERVLRLELRPDTLEPLELRRHHKTSSFVERFTAPIGIVLERIVTFRS